MTKIIWLNKTPENSDNIEIDVYRNELGVTVKITHIPTGIISISDTFNLEHSARTQAFVLLEDLLELNKKEKCDNEPLGLREFY